MCSTRCGTTAPAAPASSPVGNSDQRIRTISQWGARKKYVPSRLSLFPLWTTKRPAASRTTTAWWGSTRTRPRTSRIASRAAGKKTPSSWESVPEMPVRDTRRCRPVSFLARGRRNPHRGTQHAACRSARFPSGAGQPSAGPARRALSRSARQPAAHTHPDGAQSCPWSRTPGHMRQGTGGGDPPRGGQPR